MTYAEHMAELLRREGGAGASRLRRHVRTALEKNGLRLNHRAFLRALRGGVLSGLWHREGDGTYRPGADPDRAAKMAPCHRSAMEAVREERLLFRATVGRRGFARGQKNCRTVLLKDITKAGENTVLTDHAWMRNSPFQHLPEGSRVRFCARVRMYAKGGGLDYRFFFPTKVVRVDDSPCTVSSSDSTTGSSEAAGGRGGLA